MICFSFLLKLFSFVSHSSSFAACLNLSNWDCFSVMLLQPNGIDIFYIDESFDRNVFVATAICIPFMRNIEGQWSIVWDNQFEASKQFRKEAKANVSIPLSKELHGVKLAAGRGNYKKGKYPFSKAQASGVYRKLLRNISYLPEASIMSACAQKGETMLYGNYRIEAAMLALFQRMRRKCQADKVNAMTYFDGDVPEYRKLYRQAQVYLPTGSRYGKARNLPLDMFVKDANMKNSKHCWFTQTADIIAYAAFLKIKSERGELNDWQEKYDLGSLYDELPKKLINLRVSSNPSDGIVRL